MEEGKIHRGFSDPPYHLGINNERRKVSAPVQLSIQRELSDTPFYINRARESRVIAQMDNNQLRRQVSDTPFSMIRGSRITRERTLISNKPILPVATPVKNSRLKDSRRVVSLDSSAYKIYKESKKKMKKSKRSVSAGEEDVQGQVMNRLSFENIDVVETPLSSNRSCSEYNKSAVPTQSSLKVEEPKPKSLWTRMFSWNSGKAQTSNKVHFSTQDEEHIYRLESFRFNQANLMEGETYDYGDGGSVSGKKQGSIGSRYDVQETTSCMPFQISGVDCNSSGPLVYGNTYSPAANSVRRRRNSSNPVRYSSNSSYSAMLHESTVALDYIFGLSHYTNSYNTLSGEASMEIELKNLKEPELFVPTYAHSRGLSSVLVIDPASEDVTDRTSLHLPRVLNLDDIVGINNTNGLLLLHNNHSMGSNQSAAGLRRVASLRSLQSADGSMHELNISNHSTRGAGHHHHHHNHNHVLTSGQQISGRVTPQQQQQRVSAWALFSMYDRDTYLPVAAQLLRICSDRVRPYYPNDRGNDFFYESVRIQPFSSGAYLRGMLWAGFCSLFFNVYNFMSWPELGATSAAGVVSGVSEFSTLHHWLEMAMYCSLVVQLVLNVLQLPFRLQIHFQCWESSRAVEVDVAINVIRTMLLADSWLMNKALGDVLDALCLVSLVFSELYLWCSGLDDPLRSLVVSLCATNLLTFVSRVVVATAFSLSMHDPQVLSDARRRGLSKWDLDVLPTFLFTRPEEVNNEDCSICLGSFDMGEMLISLPCDQKHSFHAMCIRQWLQRQNSCPLCQKLV